MLNISPTTPLVETVSFIYLCVYSQCVHLCSLLFVCYSRCLCFCLLSAVLGRDIFPLFLTLCVCCFVLFFFFSFLSPPLITCVSLQVQSGQLPPPLLSWPACLWLLVYSRGPCGSTSGNYNSGDGNKQAHTMTAT